VPCCTINGDEHHARTRDRAAAGSADTVLRQLSDAVELARSAAEEEAGESEVGAYVGVELEDAAAVTHLFDASTTPATGAGAGPSRWPAPGPTNDVTVSEGRAAAGPDALGRAGVGALAGNACRPATSASAT